MGGSGRRSVALAGGSHDKGEAMWQLSEQAWTRVQPLLPPPQRGGRPRRDQRQVLGGICWKLHTGRPWRDMPERYGPWRTCYGWLRRWQADGTWPRVWAVLDADQQRSTGDRLGRASKTAAPVAAARAGLMAASPPRPPQHLPGGGGPPPQQPGKQAAGLLGRDPDQVRAWRLWAFCAFNRPPCGHRQRWRGLPPGTRGPPSPR
jgi:transposase